MPPRVSSTRDHAASTALVDRFIEHYDAWLDAAAGARDAYYVWRAAADANAAGAFAAYNEALDREEHDAGLLRASAERVSRALGASLKSLLPELS